MTQVVPYDQRTMRCLRCQGAMQDLGVKRFHTGGEGWELLSGGLSGKAVKLDVWRCISCRRVEFFDTEGD